MPSKILKLAAKMQQVKNELVKLHAYSVSNEVVAELIKLTDALVELQESPQPNQKKIKDARIKISSFIAKNKSSLKKSRQYITQFDALVKSYERGLTSNAYNEVKSKKSNYKKQMKSNASAQEPAEKPVDVNVNIRKTVLASFKKMLENLTETNKLIKFQKLENNDLGISAIIKDLSSIIVSNSHLSTELLLDRRKKHISTINNIISDLETSSPNSVVINSLKKALVEQTKVFKELSNFENLDLLSADLAKKETKDSLDQTYSSQMIKQISRSEALIQRSKDHPLMKAFNYLENNDLLDKDIKQLNFENAIDKLMLRLKVIGLRFNILKQLIPTPADRDKLRNISPEYKQICVDIMTLHYPDYEGLMLLLNNNKKGYSKIADVEKKLASITQQCTTFFNKIEPDIAYLNLTPNDFHGNKYGQDNFSTAELLDGLLKDDELNDKLKIPIEDKARIIKHRMALLHPSYKETLEYKNLSAHLEKYKTKNTSHAKAMLESSLYACVNLMVANKFSPSLEIRAEIILRQAVKHDLAGSNIIAATLKSHLEAYQLDPSETNKKNLEISLYKLLQAIPSYTLLDITREAWNLTESDNVEISQQANDIVETLARYKTKSEDVHDFINHFMPMQPESTLLWEFNRYTETFFQKINLLVALGYSQKYSSRLIYLHRNIVTQIKTLSDLDEQTKDSRLVAKLDRKKTETERLKLLLRNYKIFSDQTDSILSRNGFNYPKYTYNIKTLVSSEPTDLKSPENPLTKPINYYFNRHFFNVYKKLSGNDNKMIVFVKSSFKQLLSDKFTKPSHQTFEKYKEQLNFALSSKLEKNHIAFKTITTAKSFNELIQKLLEDFDDALKHQKSTAITNYYTILITTAISVASHDNPNLKTLSQYDLENLFPAKPGAQTEANKKPREAAQLREITTRTVKEDIKRDLDKLIWNQKFYLAFATRATLTGIFSSTAAEKYILNHPHFKLSPNKYDLIAKLKPIFKKIVDEIYTYGNEAVPTDSLATVIEKILQTAAKNTELPQVIDVRKLIFNAFVDHHLASLSLKTLNEADQQRILHDLIDNDITFDEDKKYELIIKNGLLRKINNENIATSLIDKIITKRKFDYLDAILRNTFISPNIRFGQLKKICEDNGINVTDKNNLLQTAIRLIHTDLTENKTHTNTNELIILLEKTKTLLAQSNSNKLYKNPDVFKLIKQYTKLKFAPPSIEEEIETAETAAAAPGVPIDDEINENNNTKDASSEASEEPEPEEITLEDEKSEESLVEADDDEPSLETDDEPALEADDDEPALEADDDEPLFKTFNEPINNTNTIAPDPKQAALKKSNDEIPHPTHTGLPFTTNLKPADPSHAAKPSPFISAKSRVAVIEKPIQPTYESILDNLLAVTNHTIALLNQLKKLEAEKIKLKAELAFFRERNAKASRKTTEKTEELHQTKYHPDKRNSD